MEAYPNEFYQCRLARLESFAQSSVPMGNERVSREVQSHWLAIFHEDVPRRKRVLTGYEPSDTLNESRVWSTQVFFAAMGNAPQLLEVVLDSRARECDPLRWFLVLIGMRLFACRRIATGNVWIAGRFQRRMWLLWLNHSLRILTILMEIVL